MASACDHDQQHKFYPFHQVYNLNKRACLKDLDIPPRKLLSRRAAAAAAAEIGSDMFIDSPRGEREREREQTLFQKFLPYNNVDEDDDDDADPYSADHFRMYEFKVRKCNRSRSHDWTDCPFSHPGEKARRRDPRRFNYTGTVCPEFRRGSCSRGENCEFAHGVFECWLHPSRYRTEACKDGKNCKRKVCFFAHTPRQIRILPVNCHDNISPMNSPFGVEKSPRSHCCTCCHSVSAPPLTGMTSHMSRSMSPPMMMSQSLSPPHSPMRYSPVSRFNDRFDNGGMGYKDAVTELMSSLEAMNVNEVTTPHYGTKFYNGNNNLSWVDVNFNGDDQQQFVLSPSTPSSAGSSRFSKPFMEENNNKYNDNSFVGGSGPDLGWVNDLLT